MSWWPLCWASSLDRRQGTGCPWLNGLMFAPLWISIDVGGFSPS